ncbi:MAG: hypothetical protein ACQEQ4_06475 [Fibrobacterota bacterium]
MPLKALNGYFLFAVLFSFSACMDQSPPDSIQNSGSDTTFTISGAAKTTNSEKGPLFSEKRHNASSEETTDSVDEAKPRDSITHFLSPFYLSYPEWKTISCIVSADESQYWEKKMLGLIEKSGRLRISFQDDLAYVNPVGNTERTSGNWSAVFTNDSLEIIYNAYLDIQGSPHGSTHAEGTMTLTYQNETYEMSAWFVSKNE